jgi:hypothetical protein
MRMISRVERPWPRTRSLERLYVTFDDETLVVYAGLIMPASTR